MRGMELTKVCWLLITSLITLLSFARSDPDGFLNINCGAVGNQEDQDSQHWISDSPFIKTRSVSLVQRPHDPFSIQFLTLAYFPYLGVKKYCYMLPVRPRRNYLVRATFGPDSTIPWATFFDLLIEGIKWESVNLTGLDTDEYRDYEIILAAKSQNLSLCLARNTQTESNRLVFISSIELRPLESSMYNSIDFQKEALILVTRTDYGATSKLNFSDDPFDRKWSWSVAAGNAVNFTAIQDEMTKSFGSELVNKPPVTVLSTAVGMGMVDDGNLDSFVPFSDPGAYYFALYFCQLNKTSLTQGFVPYINENIQMSDTIQLNFMQCRQAEYDLNLATSDPVNITLKPTDESELGPFINGAEMYMKLEIKETTYAGDVVAIRKIAEEINVPDDWTGGDPCLPAEYSSTGITCTHDDPPRVTMIDLRSMHLEGTIPSNIADLTALEKLLLGNNTLSGHIPDFSSLKNLRILQLQNNQLNGEIPRSMEKLQMLNQLLLQGNKLEGKISKGLVRPNLDLHVDPQNAISVGSNKNKGWVMGFLIGGSVVLVLLIISGIFLWRHKHPSQPLPSSGFCPTPAERQPIIAGVSPISDGKDRNGYHRLAVEYTEEDIKTCTNNYSTPIGRGSFGDVYYGKLSGYEVAVKIHKTDSNQGWKEFQNEVAMLSRIYHKNLVNLVGYCRQPIMALLYEYMPCGTLIDRLYGRAKLETPLDWPTRLDIARQAADGLLYLHQSCYPPIIHRDVKCSNILLDSKMSAKVADFGISKLVETSRDIPTEVRGTLGYLDPEYFATSYLNDKSDVYSFGVVLMEIISGVSPKDGIVQSAHNLLLCGKIDELMDPSLGGRYNVESAWKVAEIAYMCVKEQSTNRPKMSEVVKELEDAMTLALGENSYSASYTMATFNINDMPSLR